MDAEGTGNGSGVRHGQKTPLSMAIGAETDRRRRALLSTPQSPLPRPLWHDDDVTRFYFRDWTQLEKWEACIIYQSVPFVPPPPRFPWLPYGKYCVALLCATAALKSLYSFTLFSICVYVLEFRMHSLHNYRSLALHTYVTE